jgi:outer membrane protein OmpA-like peptidoglycan-associated protein
MKKLLLGLLIVAALSACSSSEEKMDMPMQIQTLNQTIEMNNKILAEIKSINEKSKEELAACNRDATMMKEEMKMVEAFKGTGATMMTVDNGLYLKLPVEASFVSSKSMLNENMMIILDTVTSSLMTYPETSVMIKGHADVTGPEEFNQTLSEARAMAVSTYLMEKGVDSSRIETMGVGSTEPIHDNDTKEGKMANRRVDLIIEY